MTNGCAMHLKCTSNWNIVWNRKILSFSQWESMETEGKMIVVDLLVYKLTMENNNMMLLNHIEIEAIQDLSLYKLNGGWWHDSNQYDHCETWCKCSWRKPWFLSLQSSFSLFLIFLWSDLISVKMFKTYMHGHKYCGFYPVLKNKVFSVLVIEHFWPFA